MNHVGVVVALHLIEEIFDCEFEHADTMGRVIACMGNHLEDVIGVTIVRLNLPVLKSLLDLDQSFAGQVPCTLSLLADQVNRLVVGLDAVHGGESVLFTFDFRLLRLVFELHDLRLNDHLSVSIASPVCIVCLLSKAPYLMHAHLSFLLKL